MKISMLSMVAGALFAVQSGAAPLVPWATTPPVPWAQQDPADSLYRTARRALEDKNYETAARLFDSIVSRYPRSTYAPDALYWKGFALHRGGNLGGAVEAFEAQAKQYPTAATRGDADALLIAVKGELARRGDAGARRDIDNAATSAGRSCENMEVQIAALDALQQMDAERVLPLLRRVLARRDECSAPLRKNALFVLGQKTGADREKILLEVAKSDPSKGVRDDAVFYLAQAQSVAAIDALEDLLLHANDNGVRQNALFALAQNPSDRARNILRTLLLSNDAPVALRKEAIFHLASRKGDGVDALVDVYNNNLPLELKKEAIFYIASRQDEKGLLKLISIAKTDSNLQLRKEALFHLSSSKDPRALKALEEIVVP